MRPSRPSRYRPWCATWSGRPHEDHLFLGIGRFSALNTHDRLPGIVRRLVQYTIVTSIDGSPTWRDWLTVNWLRFWLHGQRGGKFSRATVSGGTIALAGKSLVAITTKLVAIAALAAIAVLLGKLGLDAAASALHH